MGNQRSIPTIIISIIVALVVNEAAPWWWSRIFPPDPSPNPSPSNPVIPPKTEGVQIAIAYPGDNFGCVLPLFIRIGDKEFAPQGSYFLVNGIGSGEQSYQISGEIRCPSLGVCRASGIGSINIISGRTYNVWWKNTHIGECQVVLQ